MTYMGEMEGESLIKVGADRRALDFSGVNFCQALGSINWEVNFATAFLTSFDKKCVKFDKSEQNVPYLWKNSDFCTLN